MKQSGGMDEIMEKKIETYKEKDVELTSRQAEIWGLLNFLSGSRNFDFNGCPISFTMSDIIDHYNFISPKISLREAIHAIKILDFHMICLARKTLEKKMAKKQ